ncbi:MAG: helix-turn-helix domain-containing protein [[Clostridium] fimetarium]|nr:helix-turn-helix domain-containing protein [Alistipes timonensis]MCM1405384.1 helix-turn-helix domain-containing protein [[Clostridium] fimetarium]
MRPLRLAICFIILCATLAARAANVAERRYDIADGLSSPLVGGGVQAPDGLLWFATWNGLNCYDGYDFHWVKIKPGDRAPIGTDRIRDILLSAERNILCHTDDDFFEFNLATYEFNDIPRERKDSLREVMGRPWRGLTDSQGNRWNYDGSGLRKLTETHHPARVIKGTEGLHPRAMLLDSKGELLIGTRGDRAIRLYSSPDSAVLKTTLTSAPYAIYETRSGDLWVGCKPGGLSRDGSESIAPDAVYDIKEDSLGRLWVATFGDGVKCCPDPRSEHPTLSASLGGKRVRQLLITPGGILVAATTDGLLAGRIDYGDFRSTTLRPIRRDGHNPRSLGSNSTMALARDSKGYIYIATESSGIDRVHESRILDPDPEFTHFNRGNSTLPGDMCKAMALDSDTLIMVVGNDNVAAFNPESGQTVNFSRRFWGDSCRFAETTPVKLPDGSWVFGAEQGAFLATPHNLYSRGDIPPIVFTTIAINGGAEEFRLAPTTSVDLPADGRNATIRFAAIDYVDNSGILYRTRVDGSPWTAADRDRSATLFNLSPGRHLLEAQSTDRYGRWVDNNRVLEINVAPYWYETWWATLLFALLGLGAAGAIAYTYIYVRKVNRQRRELLEKYMALISSGTPAGSTAAEDSSEADTAPEPVIEKTDGSANEPQELPEKPEDTPFLNRVRRYIEENIDNPEANIDDMAAAAAASRSTLNRHLRSQLGISAAQLLTEARMQRAEQLLREPEERSLADISALCGYSDPQYFQRVFKTRHGVSAAEFRRNGLQEIAK